MDVHVFARKRVDDPTVCQKVQFHASPWLKELVPEHLSAMSFARASMGQARSLGRLIDSCSFDLVQSSGMTVALYGLMLSRLQGVSCVLDEPDAEFEKVRQVQGAGNWLGTLLAEKLFARAANHVLTSSARERRIMTASFHLADNKVSIVPNGVDTSRFAPSSRGDDLRRSLSLSARKIVLFMGNFEYFPNHDSLDIIRTELVPRVTQSVPNATFMVIGRGLSATRLQDNANVMPIGFVEDPRPYMEMADVCIAPIRYGGGTRIKILEYMSMGRAVVSTAKGSEGLEVTDGLDILIPRDWSAFAQAIVDLLKSEDRASKMGLEARKTAQRRYDWNEIGSQLVSTYKRIVDH